MNRLINRTWDEEYPKGAVFWQGIFVSKASKSRIQEPQTNPSDESLTIRTIKISPLTFITWDVHTLLSSLQQHSATKKIQYWARTLMFKSQTVWFTSKLAAFEKQTHLTLKSLTLYFLSVVKCQDHTQAKFYTQIGARTYVTIVVHVNANCIWIGS